MFTRLSTAYMLEVKCNSQMTPCILHTSGTEYKPSINLQRKELSISKEMILKKES